MVKWGSKAKNVNFFLVYFYTDVNSTLLNKGFSISILSSFAFVLSWRAWHTIAFTKIEHKSEVDAVVKRGMIIFSSIFIFVKTSIRNKTTICVISLAFELYKVKGPHILSLSFLSFVKS